MWKTSLQLAASALVPSLRLGAGYLSRVTVVRGPDAMAEAAGNSGPAVADPGRAPRGAEVHARKWLEQLAARSLEQGSCDGCTRSYDMLPGWPV